MTYSVTKTFTHEEGLSVCFRQWRATGHCSKLHGYALSISMTFEASQLDNAGWVIDFGGFREIREWLHQTFDHKTLVAEDDPRLSIFKELEKTGVLQLTVMKDVGCEAFAKYVYHHVADWLYSVMYPHDGTSSRKIYVVHVSVREHGGNKAAYAPDLRYRGDL